MFIVSAKLKPKKVIAGIILFGAILIAIILLTAHLKQQNSPAEQSIIAANDEERTAYLQSLGWIADPSPIETLTFTLPKPLNTSYLEYNELQLEQGFDLTAYAGKAVKRYSYAISNYPDRPNDVQADLYLCDDRIIAGDILCCGDDGFVATLVYPR